MWGVIKLDNIFLKFIFIWINGNTCFKAISYCKPFFVWESHAEERIQQVADNLA